MQQIDQMHTEQCYILLDPNLCKNAMRTLAKLVGKSECKISKNNLPFYIKMKFYSVDEESKFT